MEKEKQPSKIKLSKGLIIVSFIVLLTTLILVYLNNFLYGSSLDRDLKNLILASQLIAWLLFSIVLAILLLKKSIRKKELGSSLWWQYIIVALLVFLCGNVIISANMIAIFLWPSSTIFFIASLMLSTSNSKKPSKNK